MREEFVWHGRLDGAKVPVLPGTSTALAAAVVRLERTRLAQGAVAKSVIVWRDEAAHPGSHPPYEVHQAREVLELALAALPVKAVRELRARVKGARAGHRLPVVGNPEPPHAMPQALPPAPLPAEDLSFEWNLGQAGWADCRIADERSAVALHFGYCTDALRDLLGETASVIAGRASTARFSFDAEPTEYRWVLRALTDGIDVSIRRFAPFGDPEGYGELVWRSCQPRERLASVFADAAERVLDVHGEDGYLRRWVQHPFPLNELRELRHIAG